MGKDSKTNSNKTDPNSRGRLSSLTGSDMETTTSSGVRGNGLISAKAAPPPPPPEEPEFSGTPAMEADATLEAQQEFMDELRAAVVTSETEVYDNNVSTLSSAVNNLDDSVLMCAITDWMNDHIQNLNGHKPYDDCLSGIDSWISIYGG